jgi:uncharacterized protein YbcC (UPF0753/DUF2309 family)
MSTERDIRDSIDRAADVVGPAWPLHSFVTANPLAGFEDRPFHEAVQQGKRLFGADGYPSAAPPTGPRLAPSGGWPATPRSSSGRGT